jgi:hypothetical protein
MQRKVSLAYVPYIFPVLIKNKVTLILIPDFLRVIFFSMPDHRTTFSPFFRYTLVCPRDVSHVLYHTFSAQKVKVTEENVGLWAMMV